MNCIRVGGNPIDVHHRGQKPKFWPKMTPNIDIMQKSSHFGPLDNTL